MKDNVIQFPKKVSLFSDNQKQRMVEDIKTMAEDPVKVVNTIEQTLCVQAVEVTRELSSALAEKVGNAIIKFIFRE